MADETQAARELHTTVEAGSDHGTPYADPSALGFDATMLVALAMICVILLALWKKVPATIARSLDARIDAIRQQLDAATKLRAEAEALKAEYEAKAAAAAGDADAMRTQARSEAATILAKAEEDATALIARRTAMAEDKIAAAERGAIAEVRAKAASAAARAAAVLIAANHDATADRALVDGAIARLN